MDTQLRRAIRIGAPLLLGLTLLTGCASSVPLTKPGRESIRSVSINKDVKVPDDIYYHGPGQAVGALFGLIGAAIAEAAAQGPKAQLKAGMREGQIDLAQIVREQFGTELVGAGIFPSIVPEGGDAEVRLEVRIFGFIYGKPTLGVIGSLTRTDGAVLWTKYDYVTHQNDETPKHTLEEYLQNPQFMREAFTAAAKIVSGGLVRHMRQD